MGTGNDRVFVISWSQTVIDKMPVAPVSSLRAGARWRWAGVPLGIDRPCDLAGRAGAAGDLDGNENNRRRRVVSGLCHLVAAAIDRSRPVGAWWVEPDDLNVGFEVTDGHSSYIATLIFAPVDGGGDACLLVFEADLPPADTDLWVVRVNLTPDPQDGLAKQPVGMVRLRRGTRLRTPGGETRIEDISQGDQLLTRDNGVQPVLWVAQRQIPVSDPAQALIAPPVRLRGGALCAGQPDADLLVSGDHQILLQGAPARMVCGESEVLISALDLLDERRVVLDRAPTASTEHFIALQNHEVIWANAVQIESFHPANCALHTLDAKALGRLFSRYPYLAYDADAFAPFLWLRDGLGNRAGRGDDAIGVAQSA